VPVVVFCLVTQRLHSQPEHLISTPQNQTYDEDIN